MRFHGIFRSATVALLLILGTALVVCPGSARAADSIAFVDAQHGWRTTLDGSSSTGGRAVLSRTTNGGRTWRRLVTKAAGYETYRGYSGGILTFADAKRGLWLREGRADPLWRTTNGGVTWKKTSFAPREIVWDIAYASPRIAWACTGVGSAGDGGSILRSTNGGATWRKLKSYKTRAGGPPAGQFWEISCPSAKVCYILGQGARLGGLWKTSDSGAHWAKRSLPMWGVALVFPSASTGWIAGGDGSIHRTTNSGRSWRRQRSTTDERLSAGYFVSTKRGWFVGDSGTILRTTDGGATWGRFAVPTAPRLDEVLFVDATHGWATGSVWTEATGSRRVFHRTSDGGKTWQRL